MADDVSSDALGDLKGLSDKPLIGIPVRLHARASRKESCLQNRYYTISSVRRRRASGLLPESRGSAMLAAVSHLGAYFLKGITEHN